jgi:hypothetical protein
MLELHNDVWSQKPFRECLGDGKKLKNRNKRDDKVSDKEWIE